MATVYLSCNSTVAHLPECRDACSDKAKQVGGVAEGRLAAHHDTGNASVSVTQGDVDSFVNLDDPAAASIEFGHWVGGKFEDPDNPKFVPGLYIITGAAGMSTTPKQGPRRRGKRKK
jgi:hypothetical protein